MMPLGLVWIGALIAPPTLAEPVLFDVWEGRRHRVIVAPHTIGDKLEDETGPIATPGYYRASPGRFSSAKLSGRTLTCEAGTLEIALPNRPGFGPHLRTLKAGDSLDTFALQRAAQQRWLGLTPAQPRGKPEVPKGSLVIVGGGKMPAEIPERFVKASGGPDALIVYVATAHEDPIADEPAEMAMLRKGGAKTVVKLHTRDRREANDPKFWGVLDKAGGVWFSGGRHWRFIDSYEGTETERAFRRVLARGGCVGGTSAGASIQGDYMPRGHPLGNTVVSAEGYERGLNFLPGVAIDQHFLARKRQADLAGLVSRYPKYLGIGLDEGTAIVVSGRVANVIGASKAAFYDATAGKLGPDDGSLLSAGERYDLIRRKPVEPD